MNGKKSFWSTIPGILTGIAAVITAIGGIIGLLYQANVFSPNNSHSDESKGKVIVQGKVEPGGGDKTKPNRVIECSPSNPTARDVITFSASATDESGIEKIEIFIHLPSWGEWKLMKTCYSDKCVWVEGPFRLGRTIGFNAIAYDKAGNQYPGSPGAWEKYITIQ